MRRPRLTLLPAWRSFGMVFGGIWLLVGLPFVLVGVGTAREERRFATEGVAVDGIVLSKEVRRSRHDDRTYVVRYRIITRDGQEVEGRAEVGLVAWERLVERGPVPIVYLPGRPTSSRVLGEPQSTRPVIFLFVGGALTLVGGSVLVRTLFQAWAQIRPGPGRVKWPAR